MFTNAYAEEIHELEQVYTPTKWLCAILDANYEKADLNKFMETQCQHLTETQCNKLIKKSQNFEDLLDGTLVTWKIDTVDL